MTLDMAQLEYPVEIIRRHRHLTMPVEVPHIQKLFLSNTLDVLLKSFLVERTAECSRGVMHLHHGIFENWKLNVFVLIKRVRHYASYIIINPLSVAIQPSINISRSPCKWIGVHHGIALPLQNTTVKAIPFQTFK